MTLFRTHYRILKKERFLKMSKIIYHTTNKTSKSKIENQERLYEASINVQDASSRNVHDHEDILYDTHSIFKGKEKRRYVFAKEISDFAKEKGIRGLTYLDLMIKFRITKKQAQRTIKHMKEAKILFGANDRKLKGVPGFKNTNPQTYYASCIRNQIVEKKKEKYENGLVETTIDDNYKANNRYISEGSDPVQLQRAVNFLSLLHASSNETLNLHKIQLLTFFHKEYYPRINIPEIQKRKRKQIIIGPRLVEYIFSSNGTVQIFIQSSENPLPVVTYQNINHLYSYLGQVRQELVVVLGDIRETYTAHIDSWMLKGCDLNKDIQLNDDFCQITIPDLQLKYAGNVFRVYVKNIQDKTVLRSEASLSPNKTIGNFLQEQFITPHQRLENIEKMLLEIIEQKRTSQIT